MSDDLNERIRAQLPETKARMMETLRLFSEGTVVWNVRYEKDPEKDPGIIEGTFVEVVEPERRLGSGLDDDPPSG